MLASWLVGWPDGKFVLFVCACACLLRSFVFVYFLIVNNIVTSLAIRVAKIECFRRGTVRSINLCK